MPIMVLQDTIWSFQILNRVLYLFQSEAPKRCSELFFFIECSLLEFRDEVSSDDDAVLANCKGIVMIVVPTYTLVSELNVGLQA